MNILEVQSHKIINCLHRDISVQDLETGEIVTFPAAEKSIRAYGDQIQDVAQLKQGERTFRLVTCPELNKVEGLPEFDESDPETCPDIIVNSLVALAIIKSGKVFPGAIFALQTDPNYCIRNEQGETTAVTALSMFKPRDSI